MLLTVIEIIDYCTAWFLIPESSIHVVSFERSKDTWLLPNYGPLKEYDCRQIFYSPDQNKFWYRKVSNLYFYHSPNKFSCPILGHFTLFQKLEDIQQETTWNQKNHSIPTKCNYIQKTTKRALSYMLARNWEEFPLQTQGVFNNNKRLCSFSF